jgi:DNA-binding cell septation regulator SpoVG
VGVELDGEIWLRGMRMLVRENGSLFLNMPQRQMGEGERHMAYFHPVDQEARNILTAAAVPYYEAALLSKR